MGDLNLLISYDPIHMPPLKFSYVQYLVPARQRGCLINQIKSNLIPGL